MMDELSGELIEQLTRHAHRTTWCEGDDFNPGDQSGCNYDDAYGAGVEAGETFQARAVLDNLGIDWKP